MYPGLKKKTSPTPNSDSYIFVSLMLFLFGSFGFVGLLLSGFLSAEVFKSIFSFVEWG